MAALDEPDSGPAAKIRPCTLNRPTQDLVKLIFNTDTFNNAMKALEIGRCGWWGVAYCVNLDLLIYRHQEDALGETEQNSDS